MKIILGFLFQSLCEGLFISYFVEQNGLNEEDIMSFSPSVRDCLFLTGSNWMLRTRPSCVSVPL